MMSSTDKLATVHEWNTKILSPSGLTALQQIFNDIDDFEQIYIPVKIATEEGQPEDFTYVNVGLSADDLAEEYDTLYGPEYLIADYNANNWISVNRKIKSILKLNKAKYLKLIELMGYSYNPLWNVDGTDTFSYLENNGETHDNRTFTKGEEIRVTDINGTNTGTVTDSGSVSTNGTITNSATTYDNSSFVDRAKDTTDMTDTNNNTRTDDLANHVDSNLTIQTYTDTDNVDHLHDSAKNIVNGSPVEYSAGIDTFGNKVTGGDFYHTEKRVRGGNIGVTKTQELIASERDNLRYNILIEFFNDINKVILCKVFTKYFI